MAIRRLESGYPDTTDLPTTRADDRDGASSGTGKSVERSTCSFKAWCAGVGTGSLATWQKTEYRLLQMKSLIDGSRVRREMNTRSELYRATWCIAPKMECFHNFHDSVVGQRNVLIVELFSFGFDCNRPSTLCWRTSWATTLCGCWTRCMATPSWTLYWTRATTTATTPADHTANLLDYNWQ